jgi:hypothetical protein
LSPKEPSSSLTRISAFSGACQCLMSAPTTVTRSPHLHAHPRGSLRPSRCISCTARRSHYVGHAACRVSLHAPLPPHLQPHIQPSGCLSCMVAASAVLAAVLSASMC